MSTLSEFISRRRGAERRQRLNELLNYYIPPNLRPAANFAGSLTPQSSYEGAVLGFEEALTPGASVSQRVGGIGKGLSGTAGIAAPLAVAKKAGMPAAQAAQEAFQGFSTGANYAGNVVKERLNQPGEMPTLYSNPIPGLLGGKSEDVMYHGGNIEGDIKAPFFVTPDEKSAKWYADESGGSVSRHSVNIKNPLKVGSQKDNKKFLEILKKNGIDVNNLEDMIFDNSPYDGTNILDAAYVPEVRAALKKEGYDSLFNPYDQLENTEIPAYAIIDDSVFSPNTVETSVDSKPTPRLLGPTGKPLKKEELDPLGYQATKMRGILDETEVDLEDLGENLPRIPRSWEEMENKYVIPLYGDRTSRGFLLKGINDLKFDMPVYTEGGLDFMRGPAFQEQNAVWASNSNIIKRIADEAEKARIESKGEDMFGMTGSMAPNANDFATMTGSAIAEQIKGAKITRKGASEFNELVRGAISSDFPGVRSPKLREWIEKTSSPKRKAFIRLIDTKPFQEQGFPSVGLGRYGVTDITQRKLPPGMFGMGVSKFDELQPILRKDPSGNRPGILVPHSTYNTQITGEYFGSLPPVPQGLVFKDVYDAMEGGVTKAGKPLTSAHKTHAIKTIMPVQKLRPDIIEGILGYVSSLEK